MGNLSQDHIETACVAGLYSITHILFVGWIGLMALACGFSVQLLHLACRALVYCLPWVSRWFYGIYHECSDVLRAFWGLPPRAVVYLPRRRRGRRYGR